MPSKLAMAQSGRPARTMALLAVVCATGCVPADQGGGGGLGAFTRGFVFVKPNDGNIYLADQSAYSATPIQLTTNGRNHHPSLSPDGRQVVFVHDFTELDVVSASTGATPTSIYFARSGQTNLRNPVFSPDGSTIVFSYDRSSNGFLGMVSKSGAGFKEITSPSFSVSSPSFYPDGNNVLVIRRSSSFFYDQLAKVTLSSGAVTGIASSLGNEACAISNRAVLSPDATKVAFDARTFVSGVCQGAARIFVMFLPGGPFIQLTDYPATPNATDGFPTWVGSDQVGYSSTFGGAEQIYTLSALSTQSSGSLKVPTASEPWFGPN